MNTMSFTLFTTLFSVASTPFATSSTRSRLSRLYETISYPVVSLRPVAVWMWSWMDNGSSTRPLRASAAADLLARHRPCPWSGIIVSVWKVIGYNMIISRSDSRTYPANSTRPQRSTAQALAHLPLITLPLSSDHPLRVGDGGYNNLRSSPSSNHSHGKQGGGAQVDVLVSDIQPQLHLLKMGSASAEAMVLSWWCSPLP
jgi:hypothetical protein